MFLNSPADVMVMGTEAASVLFSLQDLMQQNEIAYVLNASNTCPKPDFISDSHFLRVPVNDSFCEKILPWLDRSVEFIGQRAKTSQTCQTLLLLRPSSYD